MYVVGTGIHTEVNYEGEQLWMTQAKIACLYGRDVSTISRHMGKIERGERNVTLLNLCRIASALGTKPSTLLSAAEL